MIMPDVLRLRDALHLALIELERFRDAHDYSPSLREMCFACNVASTSTMARHYRQLADMGLVAMNNGEMRTLRPTALGRLYLSGHEESEPFECAHA